MTNKSVLVPADSVDSVWAEGVVGWGDSCARPTAEAKVESPRRRLATGHLGCETR
jgi:hypothetical protein